MSDSDDLRFREMPSKRGQHPPPRRPDEPVFNTREFSSVRTLPPPPPPRAVDDSEEEGGFKLPVDQWRIAMAIKRRWVWVLAAACVGTVLGFVNGYFKVPYKIDVTLMRPASAAFDSGMVGGAFRPEPLTLQTLVNLIKSPELIHRVAAKARTPVSEAALKKSVDVKLELQTELITLTIPGKTPQSLLELTTNYVNEILQMGKELQTGATSNLNTFYKARIKLTRDKLIEANNQLLQFQNDFHMVDPETQDFGKRLSDLLSKSDDARMDLDEADLQIAGLESEPSGQNTVYQDLADAENELRKLRTKMKDAHPQVQAHLKYIAELKQKLAEFGTTGVPTVNSGVNPPVSANDPRLKALQNKKATAQRKLDALDKQKQDLQGKVTGISSNAFMHASLKAEVDSLNILLGKMTVRQGETQLFLDDAQGYYKLVGMDNIDVKARWMRVIKFALIGFVLGALGAGAVIGGFEVLDDSLKTTVDVERVTGLPMLATLGDLNTMSPAEKDDWAFRTWTALSGQLSASPNHGMVCGFISSLPGEGRSTWINLLVNAAGQRGFRVLTVATRPPRSDPETGVATASETERQFGDAIGRALAATRTEAPEKVATLTPQALAFPAEVTRQLTGPNAPPVAHIPLPGWVWNLDRRKQWQSALAHWRAIDNLVLLVELPPASVPESVLLAENLPQLIWLVDSGKPRKRATREQLETLRYAKCRLVGAVLNHEPKPVFEL